jgi:hypothetical protein
MLVLLPVPEDAPPAAGPLLEPLPVVMPSSFRHFSRSDPVMPRHLLLVLPVLGEAALGELVPLPVPPLALLPDAPEELLPVAPALVPPGDVP